MIKKLVFILLLGIFSVFVDASGTSVTRIGNNYYDTLEEAIINAKSTDTITLISNVNLDEPLLINKVINLNLNGKTITSPSKVFEVIGGTLNVSGKGTIKETKPSYGAVFIKGSNKETDSSYSVVNIGKEVTLEVWSGLFITHDAYKSYGVVVNLEGKINAVSDVDGNTGVGVYVNGNITHKKNPPVINIKDGATITSSGNGLYIAGYSTFNIGKAYISGIESGIGIKAGNLNIDGATVICDGKDDTPTEGFNNGIKSSGTTIQIESNNGYAGDINLNIKAGSFKSKNSNVIYEYIGRGTNSLVSNINISSGTFISEANKNVFSFSDSFKTKHSSFITGGNYSSNPNTYLKTGYTTTLENNLFKVIKNTVQEVNSSNFYNGKQFGKGLIFIVTTAIFCVLIYFNRIKILNVFKKI